MKLVTKNTHYIAAVCLAGSGMISLGDKSPAKQFGSKTKREVDVAYKCFSWRCLIMIGRHTNGIEDVFNRHVFRHALYVAFWREFRETNVSS